MHSKPQVTIDLDEYNELQEKSKQLSGTELTSEEISEAIDCILHFVEYYKLSGAKQQSIFEKLQYDRNIEIIITESRIDRRPKFKVIKHGNLKG